MKRKEKNGRCWWHVGICSVTVFSLYVAMAVSCRDDDHSNEGPKIISISPTEGPADTKVTIKGEGFTTTSKNNVSFNGVAATVENVSATELKATVPDGAGTGKVQVIVGDQLAEGPEFRYVNLAITGITPAEGPSETEVIITGTGFNTTASKDTVRFNGIIATINSATETTLKAKVPKGAGTGKVKVTVGRQSVEGPEFKYIVLPGETKVTITGISPTEGVRGTNVTIKGTGFSTTSSENTVLFNGVVATVSSASATELIVSVPPGAGTGKVKVTTDGQSVDGPEFKYLFSIANINPTEGPHDTDVTITGVGFSNIATENAVKFNGVVATVLSATPTELKVKVPKGAGTGNVSVTVGKDITQGPQFKYLFSIATINPTAGTRETEVIITGIGFSAVALDNIVKFNGVVATVLSASLTELKVKVPPGAGTGNVSVAVGRDFIEGPLFNYLFSIASINPTEGARGTDVIITGSGFSDLASENVVKFNGVTATVTSVSSTQLTVKVPARAGTGKVSVSVGSDFAQGPQFKYVLTPVVSTFAGSATAGTQDGTAALATFTTAFGMVFDQSGNLYVVDQGANRIRKIDTHGQVSTVAGSTQGFADGTGTAAQFDSPYGIAFFQGNLYVTCLNAVRKVTPTGVVSTLTGTYDEGNTNGATADARFAVPSGIVVNSFGVFLVSERIAHRVRSVVPPNTPKPFGAVTVLAGSGTNGHKDGTGINAQFADPISLAIDRNNNVYVADRSRGYVRKVTHTGVVSTVAGVGVSGYADGAANQAKFNKPYGVAIDNGGNIYVADTENYCIRKITPDNVVTTVAGTTTPGYADGEGTNARFSKPVNIAIHTNGDLYVSDGSKIRKITFE